MWNRARALAATGLALACTLPAGAAELTYHFQPGETFTYQMENKAKAPSVGDIITTMTYEFVAEDPGDPSGLAVDISGESNKFEPGDAHATFDLDGDGAVSNLQSDKLDDPVDGAAVKNVAGLFPRFPGGDLAVGQTWTQEAALHLPEMNISGSFTKLRTISDYEYKGTETGDDGRVLHVIESQTRHKPGEKGKLSLTTTTYFDAELGRAVRSSAAGWLKVKVSFLWVKIPTTYTMTELGEPQT
jgi:hypothetical protein